MGWVNHRHVPSVAQTQSAVASLDAAAVVGAADPDGVLQVNVRVVDLDDLKWVVLMVLFNQPGSEAAYAWMETQMFLDEPEPVH